MSCLVRIVAVAGASVALLATGSGLAVADNDPLIGKTYGDAVAAVSNWGNTTAVIDTVVGGRLSTDDCFVSSWRRANFLDIGGAKRPGSTVLMNINCNAAVASAGSPGASAGSPEGRVAKHNIETGKWCMEPEQAEFDPCLKFCAGFEKYCTA